MMPFSRPSSAITAAIHSSSYGAVMFIIIVSQLFQLTLMDNRY